MILRTKGVTSTNASHKHTRHYYDDSEHSCEEPSGLPLTVLCKSSYLHYIYARVPVCERTCVYYVLAYYVCTCICRAISVCVCVCVFVCSCLSLCSKYVC